MSVWKKIGLVLFAVLVFGTVLVSFSRTDSGVQWWEVMVAVAFGLLAVLAFCRLSARRDEREAQRPAVR